MFRYSYLLFAVLFISCKSFSENKQSSGRYDIRQIEKDISNLNLKVDTLAAAITTKDTATSNRQISGTSSAVNDKLYILKQDDKWEVWKYILTFLVSLLAFRLSYRSAFKERSNKHFEYLSEIDKQLMADPYLWAIYDTEKDNYKADVSSSQATQQEIDGKVKAYCYFHLNNFELVFLYPPRNRKSRRTW